MLYKESSNFLPLYLDVKGKKILVVGAGKVALRKISVLINYNLHITVLASDILPEIKELSSAHSGKVTIIQSNYSDEYLEKDHYLAIFAATNDKNVNENISLKCSELGLLCNNVTSLDSSHFIMPAIIMNEDFQIAVSTSGKAPCVSKFIKNELNETFIPEITKYIPLIEKIRAFLKSNNEVDEILKQKLYEKVLNSRNLMEKLSQDEADLNKALNLLIEELK